MAIVQKQYSRRALFKGAAAAVGAAVAAKIGVAAENPAVPDWVDPGEMHIDPSAFDRAIPGSDRIVKIASGGTGTNADISALQAPALYPVRTVTTRRVGDVSITTSETRPAFVMHDTEGVRAVDFLDVAEFPDVPEFRTERIVGYDGIVEYIPAKFVYEGDRYHEMVGISRGLTEKMMAWDAPTKGASREAMEEMRRALRDWQAGAPLVYPYGAQITVNGKVNDFPPLR